VTHHAYFVNHHVERDSSHIVHTLILLSKHSSCTVRDSSHIVHTLILLFTHSPCTVRDSSRIFCDSSRKTWLITYSSHTHYLPRLIVHTLTMYSSWLITYSSHTHHTLIGRSAHCAHSRLSRVSLRVRHRKRVCVCVPSRWCECMRESKWVRDGKRHNVFRSVCL